MLYEYGRYCGRLGSSIEFKCMVVLINCSKNNVIFIKDSCIQPRVSLVKATTWLNLIEELKAQHKEKSLVRQKIS